jgi:hypothetical protein
MSEQHKAIENPENVCFNCLQKGEVHKIHISALGYGSSFDNWSSEIHLCPSCLAQTNSELWELEEIQCEWDRKDNHGFTEYKYEKEILEFVNNMPIEGKELFFNRYSSGDSYYMESQDWIDYELGILPHEKCKEYCMYSPDEERAYQEKFPICDNVKIVKYEDGSQGLRCPFGAFGNKDGTAQGHQTQNECYECRVFIPREENKEIEIMDKEEMEIYKLQNELALKILLKRIKDKND